MDSDFVFPGPEIPERVVSLVPSLTESLFDLGLGDRIVGITDYCTQPADKLGELARVGGPKDARLDDILKLNPDLVIANREENLKALVDDLIERSIPVWVTYPRTVTQTLEMLEKMAQIFRSPRALMEVRSLMMAVDWMRAAASEQPARRYFCPIWQDLEDENGAWWMTFSRDTYMDDLLGLLGGVNAIADKPERYPRVSLDEIIRADPELILLPDEPFAYNRLTSANWRDFLLTRRLHKRGS